MEFMARTDKKRSGQRGLRWPAGELDESQQREERAGEPSQAADPRKRGVENRKLQLSDRRNRRARAVAIQEGGSVAGHGNRCWTGRGFAENRNLAPFRPQMSWAVRGGPNGPAAMDIGQAIYWGAIVAGFR